MPATTRRVGRAGRFVEPLDARLLFNASYFPLAAGPLIQDWSNTSLIQTIHNWSNVPGIEGYRGSTLGVSETAVDPQTVLAPNDPAATTYVDANKTSPAATTAGGLAEFHLPDPVVAMQGSVNAPAPHLLIHLDTSGLADPVPVSYLLRDIDPQLDKAIQPVAAEYRIGTSGNFTNIPEAFVADAAGDGGTASKTTPVSFTLPVGALGHSQVQLRLITTDAAGVDEWIGVDNLSIGTVIPKSIQLAQSKLQVNEGAGTLDITLTRSGDLGAAAQVRLTSADLTAAAGQDYTAVDQVVTFAIGQSSRTIQLPILDNQVAESAERLTVALSEASGAALGEVTQTIITIIDDDSTAPTGMRINEISVNPPGAVDTPHEFAELRGPAFTPLFNVYLVQFEGDLTAPGGKSGVADVVFDLGAASMGGNGMMLIKGAGGFEASDPATTIVTSTILSSGQDALENDAQTWQLVFSPIPIVEGYDYDPGTTSGGSLNLPAGAVVLDSVAWYGFADQYFGVLYSNAVLVLQQASIHAVTRLRNDLSSESVRAWYFGQLLDNNGSASLAYDPALASGNLPADAVLTPGGANYTAGPDVDGPAVLSVDWQYDLVAMKPGLIITFSEPVQGITLTDLASSSFTLIDRSTNLALPADDLLLGVLSASICKIAFAGNGTPPDGDFKLVINPANVKDLEDNAMAVSVEQPFAFLQADATNDRRVDTRDFNVLAGHFAQTATRFSQGDFNFDGQVDSLDFSHLLSSYGKVLVMPASPALFAPPSRSDEPDEADV